jgi:hypothetical protein
MLRVPGNIALNPGRNVAHAGIAIASNGFGGSKEVVIVIMPQNHVEIGSHSLAVRIKFILAVQGIRLNKAKKKKKGSNSFTRHLLPRSVHHRNHTFDRVQEELALTSEQ